MADQSRHAFDAAAFDPMIVNNEILALRRSFAGILE
jgi:hypothetical protein